MPITPTPITVYLRGDGPPPLDVQITALRAWLDARPAFSPIAWYMEAPPCPERPERMSFAHLLAYISALDAPVAVLALDPAHLSRGHLRREARCTSLRELGVAIHYADGSGDGCAPEDPADCAARDAGVE